MDSKVLAESAVGVLTPLFDGTLYGPGERTAAQLYPVIARRLRAVGDGATVSGWEAAPGTPRAGAALAQVLERRLSEDVYFAEDVAGVLSRMPGTVLPAVPGPAGADHGRAAALGGLAVAAAAAVVLAVVLLLLG
jgi:hypothetical protein